MMNPAIACCRHGKSGSLPYFRYVKELRVKAIDTRDARSAVRASIAASAYFPN